MTSPTHVHGAKMQPTSARTRTRGVSQRAPTEKLSSEGLVDCIMNAQDELRNAEQKLRASQGGKLGGEILCVSLGMLYVDDILDYMLRRV